MVWSCVPLIKIDGKIPNPTLPSQFSTFGSSVKSSINTFFGGIQQVNLKYWIITKIIIDLVAWSSWRYRRVFKIRKCQYFNRKCPNWFIQCQYAKVNMIMVNEITNCNIYCSQGEPSSTNEQSMNNEQKFHDVDLKETKLRILKRYTNLDVIYSITILYSWLTLLRLLVPGHRDLFCTFYHLYY